MSDLISRQAAIMGLIFSDGTRDLTCGQMAKILNAIKALPSAQPEQRWIPCSERLPSEYGMYLVTMTEKAKAEELGFDVDEIDVKKMRYNSNGWQLPRHIPSWINNAVTDEVMAWMTLLESYAERREDG